MEAANLRRAKLLGSHTVPGNLCDQKSLLQELEGLYRYVCNMGLEAIASLCKVEFPPRKLRSAPERSINLVNAPYKLERRI